MARRRQATTEAPPEVQQTPANAVEAGTTHKPRAPVAKFAGLPANWVPVEQAIPNVTAVRTCIPSLNLATRVGGLPDGRVVTVHGATHGGKTAFVLALVGSYLRGGHAVGYVDAEHSLDKMFVGRIVEDVAGAPLKELHGFMARQPNTYEETIAHVNELLKWATDQRKRNPAFRLLLVVDSINKLTPKRELEAILKQAAGESEGGGGKGGRDKGDQVNKGWGRMRAGMNQAWLDHLIPRLQPAGCTFVVIAQERDVEDAMPWEMDMMSIYGVKGGAALKFDASLLARITKVSGVKEGEGKDAKILAWKHNIRIWKSKVGAMDGRWTDAQFYIRLDGTLDTARNLLHTGIELGVVHKADSSSWMTYGRVKLNGEKAWVARLDNDVELMNTLIEDVANAVDKVCKREQAE